MYPQKNPFFLGKKYEKNPQKNSPISSEMTMEKWKIGQKSKKIGKFQRICYIDSNSMQRAKKVKGENNK